MERHIPAIRRTRGLRLVGVVDRRPDRAEAAGRRAGVGHATRLRDVRIDTYDAVSIGTSPPAHEELAREAISYGKHLIVEKPFAMTPHGANELVAAARAAGVTCAVVHNFQFARSVQRARSIITSGRDGALRGVLGIQLSNDRRRLPEWYRSLPGGLFYDEAPHLFYLARAFAGDVRISSAFASGTLAAGDLTPRVLAAQFSSSTGTTCTLHFEFGAALSEWQLILMLERATLFCDLFRDVLVRVPDDDRHTARRIMRTSALASLSHWAGVARSGSLLVAGRLDYGNDEVFRRFAAAAAGQGTPDGIAADDGAAVVALMHDALAAAGQPARRSTSET